MVQGRAGSGQIRLSNPGPGPRQGPLTIQRLVRLGKGVLDRLQMGQDVGMGQGGAHLGLDPLHQIVPLFYRPAAWHQDMHLDEDAGAGLTGPEGMEIDALAPMSLHDRGQG